MKKINNIISDKEYINIIKDLLETKEVQKLQNYKQHHSVTRLEHSLNVSYMGYKLAKKRNLDYVSVARAGLLHDLFYYDWHTSKFDEGSHAYMHPRIAYKNALKITKLNKIEKDIIIKHMFGATIAPPKYKESWLVTMVDKYCAIQEFSGGMISKINTKILRAS